MGRWFDDFASEVEALKCIAEGMGDMYSNDELLTLGLAQYPGPVGNLTLAAEADERLEELLEGPVAV